MRRRRAVDPRTGRLYRVVAKPARLGAPPPALRRATLDNLALVPASLLPYKQEWQQLANRLPRGATWIGRPASGSRRQRRTLETVATGLRAQGRTVATVPARRFIASHL